MFHIQGLDGMQFNIPLEDLKNNEKIDRLTRSYTVRKIIDKKERQGGDARLTHAVRAYKDSIPVKNEREPLLHAYTIMKSPVITLDPDMTIGDAWNYLKEKGIGHMPVLSGEKKILGIMSDRDLLKCLCITDCGENDAATKTVRDVMTRKVITASRLTDIRRIAKAMFDNHIGTMPIVDDNSGELMGIITRSDILYALVNYPPLSLWV